MSSLIDELQRAAADPKISTTELLRKARIAASKLDSKDFEDWTRQELNGYKNVSELPGYRIVQGTAQAFNRWSGRWEAIAFEDPQHENFVSQGHLFGSLGELEDVPKDGEIYLTFPPENLAVIREAVGESVEARISLSHSHIDAALHAVRNTILEWSLKLEKEGIVGEGLSFSPKEKEKANAITIENLLSVAHMENSQIQQGTSQSSQEINFSEALKEELARFLHTLRTELEKSELDPDDRQDIDAETATIEAQLSSRVPKPTIIKESLSSLKTILEGAVAGLLTTGVEKQIPALIDALGKLI